MTDPVDKESPHQIRTVLLVDDNDDLRVLAKWFFDSVGFVVETARSAEEALAASIRTFTIWLSLTIPCRE